MPAPAPKVASAVLARWVLIAAGLLILLVVLVLFLWHAVFVLLLLFAGLLVAILLREVADVVRRLTQLPPGWSLATSLLGLLLLTVAAGWLMAPRVIEQVNELSQSVPDALEALRLRAERYPLGRWIMEETPPVSEMRPDAPQVLARATGIVSATVGMTFGLVIVLFLGIYLAADPVLYTNGALRLLPQRHRARGAEVLAAVGYTLRWWLVGQLITMACVGVLTALGLWALGVPLWMSLGLLAALLEFVPNFGPVIAAAPAVLLVLAQNPAKAGAIAVLYLVVQQVESLLISPLVHQKTVRLPPVLTILSQVLLGILVGPLGLLLATPLTAVALVLVKLLYVEQTLGDSLHTPLDELDAEDKPPLPQPKPEDPEGETVPSDGARDAQ